jgi:YegS/Rv2252/BmrU family lipid kinase
MFKKVMLVVSPVSRPAWVRRYIPKVLDTLKAAGMDVERFVTKGPGDPGRLAREEGGRFDAVLVAGGDGSINETMNALCGTPTPVGILPFGTVNVFAREMGIPLRPLEAARTFITCRERAFDMGRIGDRRFLLMASFGFDVLALRRTPKVMKRLFGRYGYLITSFCIYPFYRDREIEVFLGEDETPQRAHFAVFSNSRYYAGNYVVAPKADMEDGLLDVTLFCCPGRRGLWKIFTSFLKGDHLEKPWVKTARVSRVRFQTRDPDLMQIDGDPIDPDEQEITVEARAIRVAVPA